MNKKPSMSPHRGVVAAGHSVTAGAAAEIIDHGGNAFDAIVSALWAACVAEPVLASPGGGGFLLAKRSSGETLIHDFFAHTPKMRRDHEDFYKIFVDFGVAQQAFHVGPGSAATPGFVRGLFDVHRKYCSMPMSELVLPALQAARSGVELTAYQSYLLNVIGPIFEIDPVFLDIYKQGSTIEDRLKNPNFKEPGESYKTPDLADLIEVLAREGDELFYQGEIAQKIESFCHDHGGHLTRDDLSSYQSITRKPLDLSYRGAQLSLNPPPSSGGFLISLTLELLKDFELCSLGFGSVKHSELLVRALDATNQARSEVFPETEDNLRVPHDIIQKYKSEISSQPAFNRGTTHISVIDVEGNAASSTLSNGEGCGHALPGTGFMLNNMLGEEDLCPDGVGVWPVDRRMSSMMCPLSIQFDDGGFAVLGSGGSNRIRTALLQVISAMLDFGMDANEAVMAPRIHLEGNHLDFEAFFPEETQRKMAETYPDHQAWPERNMFFGGTHLASHDSQGQFHGTGDPRRGGVVLFL